MALPAALAIGTAAALVIPRLIERQPDMAGGVLARGIVQMRLGDVQLFWSWPVFAVVTLFAWGLLAAARDR